MTLAERFRSEVDAAWKLLRERPVLGALFLLSVLGFGAWSTLGYFQVSAELETCQEESRELARDLRQVKSENAGLNQTIAPLLLRATEEFPGEEILDALSKVIDGLDPCAKPIVTAKADVSLFFETEEPRTVHFADVGGYLIFGRVLDGELAGLLLTSAPESRQSVLKENRVELSGRFEMHSGKDSAAGRPLRSLLDADHIQIMFHRLPVGAFVEEGSATVVINNGTRFVFKVPAQVASDGESGGRVIIEDPKRVLKSVCPQKGS